MTSQDHDQRFKTLLKEFFGPFFRLFWPERARWFDFGRVEWLENEAFPDPPQGKRRSLDLVPKLPLAEPVETETGELATQMLVIVHVEVESADSVRPLRETMFHYYACLRQKHAEPVLPVAVYLNVGLEGLGTDSYVCRFGDLTVMQYNFLYVGLPALDGSDYLEQGEPLAAALSALMRVPRERRPQHKMDALRQVIHSDENEYHKFLLAELVQAYMPLDDAAEQDFKELLEAEQNREVKMTTLTWFEEGVKKEREAQRAAQRLMLVKLLERKWEQLDSEQRRRVVELADDELFTAFEAKDQSNSLDEFFSRLPAE